MVGNRLDLLLEPEQLPDLERAAERLGQLVPGIDVDRFAEAFPAVLDVDDFEGALLVRHVALFGWCFAWHTCARWELDTTGRGHSQSRLRAVFGAGCIVKAPVALLGCDGSAENSSLLPYHRVMPGLPTPHVHPCSCCLFQEAKRLLPKMDVPAMLRANPGERQAFHLAC
jgi:hypothetical protein